MIEVIPAIDLIDGRCVRLTRGDYDQVREYSDAPLDVARAFEDAGCRHLHLVDLDGAKSQHIVNYNTLKDIMYSTWSPYPLFRLTAPLYFKTIAIEPGYYLLTPREHDGAWFMLFKEAGRIKYIIPCYKKEMVPMDFYKNHLPQVKMTKPQLIREKFLNMVGKNVKSSKRQPIPDTYLEADDLNNNFVSIIVYWGNYRYYFVLRTIQL